MTLSVILGVLACIAGLVAIVATCHLLVQLARDWAEDRAREERFAEEWRAVHKSNQDLGRYGDHNRPE